MPTMENILKHELPWYYDLAWLEPGGFVLFETEVRRDLGSDWKFSHEMALEELCLTALCIDIEVNPERYTF